MSTGSTLMTIDDLLAMPDDGVERWLIRGELREKSREASLTKRNRFHSSVMSRIAAELVNWVRRQPEPRGDVLSGEAGVVLGRDPDTGVGVDVAYVDAATLSRQTDDSTLIVGAPTLVVEILSPSDMKEELDEKIDTYLEAGVRLIWIVDPHRRTVVVHRPDAEPELFNVKQEISAEPHLPGFRVPVLRFFD
jgi:Uma2 family endonuclease